MNKIYRALPDGLRERPLDFYTALVLMLVGVYGILDDTFPERFQDQLTILLVNIISIYLMISSSVILVALMKDRRKYPAFTLFGQLFGWAFISAAALAASLLYAINLLISGSPDSWAIWLLWVLIWFGMFFSAMLRTMELYFIYRGCKK